MDTSARKTIDDLRRQANVMMSSGYSLTTTAHVLGVNTDTLKKWVDFDTAQNSTAGRKLARKM